MLLFLDALKEAFFILGSWSHISLQKMIAVSLSLYLLARQALVWADFNFMNLVAYYIKSPWHIMIDQSIHLS